MTRRITFAILSVTIITVLLFGIPLAIVIDRIVDDDSTMRVERQAVLAARAVPSDYQRSHDPVELPAEANGITTALYDTHGLLVTGIGPTNADQWVTAALTNRIATAETEAAIVVAVPVTADEAVIGVIRSTESTSRADARMRRTMALIVALGLGVIAIGALIGAVVARRLARPVRRLRDSAVRIGDGDFTVDIDRSGIPELDSAANALARTAHRLDDLVRRERAFSSDASHQLRTPLAGLRTNLETELTFPRQDRREILREALDDVDRLERTVVELLALARTSDQTASTCTLADVQAQLRDNWHGRFAAVGRPLTMRDASDVPPLAASAPVLRHALDVLLDNAYVHGDGPTRIDHDVATDAVTIIVSDTGPGFVANTPGAATVPKNGPSRPGGSPHGLGLDIARRLIDSMPGRLLITNPGPSPRIEVVVARADGAQPPTTPVE